MTDCQLADRLMVPRPFFEIQQIEDHTEKQRPGDGRGNRSHAAGQKRAADHDRGDGGKLPSRAFQRLARAIARGKEDPGQTRTAA